MKHPGQTSCLVVESNRYTKLFSCGTSTLITLHKCCRQNAPPPLLRRNQFHHLQRARDLTARVLFLVSACVLSDRPLLSAKSCLNRTQKRELLSATMCCNRNAHKGRILFMYTYVYYFVPAIARALDALPVCQVSLSELRSRPVNWCRSCYTTSRFEQRWDFLKAVQAYACLVYREFTHKSSRGRGPLPQAAG